MKAVATVVLASTFVFGGPLASAQNASTGAVTKSSEAAAPTKTDPNPGSTSDNHPSLGAGIASGTANNGSTGDTIGTGHGTTPGPAADPNKTGNR